MNPEGVKLASQMVPRFQLIISESESSRACRGVGVFNMLRGRGLCHWTHDQGAEALNYLNPLVKIVSFMSVDANYVKWLRENVRHSAAVLILDYTTDTLDPSLALWIDESGEEIDAPPHVTESWPAEVHAALMLHDAVLCSYPGVAEKMRKLGIRAYHVPDANRGDDGLAYLQGLVKAVRGARKYFHRRYVRAATGRRPELWARWNALTTRASQHWAWKAVALEMEEARDERLKHS